MDSNKSAGYGRITRFTQVPANIIAAPYRYLLNTSICQSIFPSDLKATVIFTMKVALALTPTPTGLFPSCLAWPKF